MKSIRPATLFIALSIIFITRLSAQTTWLVNNVTNIGNFKVTKYGTPQVITTPFGNAVLFNGTTDGLIISNNPIAGWTNFTVEMIFRPDPSTVATQPRMIHIQSVPNPPDHRLTLEGRITNNQWYADTFVQTASTTGNNITLSNTNNLHSLGDWQDLAVTYDGSQFKNYVNGRQEISGAVSVGALTNGLISIGMRANFVNYFQGAILALRFTPRALATNEFMCIPKEIISGMTLTGGVANMDFTLTSGIPIGFNLAEASSLNGPWSNSVGAVLTTNSPGVSYHFTTNATNALKFYRVFWQ